MIKKNKSAITLLIILSLMVSLVGCQKEGVSTAKAPETKNTQTHEHSEEIGESHISEWEGNWNNLHAYLKTDEMKEAIDEGAKNSEVSVEEFLDNFDKRRHVDFDGLIIEGEHVQFLDDFDENGGHIIYESDYEFQEKHMEDHGGRQMAWDIFKAKDSDSKFPILMMMEVHGEESLPHFHMRYGDDLDSMLTMDGWYPTFVRNTSTLTQIAEEISE